MNDHTTMGDLQGKLLLLWLTQGKDQGVTIRFNQHPVSTDYWTTSDWYDSQRAIWMCQDEKRRAITGNTVWSIHWALDRNIHGESLVGVLRDALSGKY